MNQILDYLLDGAPINKQYDSIDSELFFGLAYPLGVESKVKYIVDVLLTFLTQKCGYSVHVVNIENLILESSNTQSSNHYKRLMDGAFEIGRHCQHYGALAAGAVAQISKYRKGDLSTKRAYIINAVKRPDELKILKRLYKDAFYLISLYMPERERRAVIDLPDNEAFALMERDEYGEKYDTASKKVCCLADLFINLKTGYTGCSPEKQIDRFLNLVFGNPYVTPTFSEHAMFMAYCNACHSSDLSRQVGATLTRGNQILAVGANECPCFGGGQYYTLPDFTDVEKGKDYKLEIDSNASTRNNLIDKLIEELSRDDKFNDVQLELLKSKMKESESMKGTEFGRMIHAEMNALMSCARLGLATQDSILYCTTFPCHNCAKHLVTAGVRKVFFVEPYEKSKALELFEDSIGYYYSDNRERVVFEPYMGISARRYLDLFSINLGHGEDIKRKQRGKIINYELNNVCLPRCFVPIQSYERHEQLLVEFWNNKGKDNKDNNIGGV